MQFLKTQNIRCYKFVTLYHRGLMHSVFHGSVTTKPKNLAVSEILYHYVHNILPLMRTKNFYLTLRFGRIDPP